MLGSGAQWSSINDCWSGWGNFLAMKFSSARALGCSLECESVGCKLVLITVRLADRFGMSSRVGVSCMEFSYTLAG